MGLSTTITDFCSRNHQFIAYACLAVASSLMHSIFMLYYVKVFLEIYHVDETWFQISQLLFLVWNALNDPLFGYCQDHCKTPFNRTRRHTILYGAPLFALSFLLPWFPWPYGGQAWMVGLHLIVALFFYDAMYTYVLLCGSCLMTEMSDEHSTRLKYNQFYHVGGLIGSVGVLVCSTASDNLKNFSVFQMLCIVAALISWMAMTYTGLHCKTAYEKLPRSSPNDDFGCEVDRETEYSIWTLTWQLITQQNFLMYVCSQFLCEFNISFLTNFATIIGGNLMPDSVVPAFARNILYGVMFLLPRILFITCTPILASVGYYRIFLQLLLLKVFSAAIMFLIGRNYPWITVIFISCQCITCGLTTGFIGLGLSDVVDEDQKSYKRKHPLSSMVYGTNALITKPAISLAPMVILYVFNLYGYQEFQKNKDEPSSDLIDIMFLTSCAIPFFVGIIQYIFISNFTIRNSHKTTRCIIDFEA